MRRAAQWIGIVAAVVVGAGLAGPVTSAAQRIFEKPTADTGPTEVTLVGSPVVGAVQAGRWSVAVEGKTDVVVRAPAFLRRGESYLFRWAGDQGEVYRLIEVSDDGWVHGELAGSAVRRWLNPARAISIERAGH